MSLYTLALIGSGPLNALLAGTLANAVGVPLTLATSGLLMAAGVAIIASRHPALLNLDTTEGGGEPVLPAASEAILEPVGRSR